MRKWKTYIVDDFTPFHGMHDNNNNTEFNRNLENYNIALIVTDGKSIDVWGRRDKDYVLIEPSEKLSTTNLQNDFKETFNYGGARHFYKNQLNIEISEPTLYNTRKITI